MNTEMNQDGNLNSKVKELIRSLLKQTEERAFAIIDQAQAGDEPSLVCTMKGPFEVIVAGLYDVEEKMQTSLVIKGLHS